MMDSVYSGKKHLQIFWFVFFFILIAYSVIYNIYPFSELVNDWILNIVYMTSVVVPAIAASAVLKNYGKEEHPHKIWLYITVGFWVWAVAELTWIAYNMLLGEVPSLSLADPLYLIGYFYLILAILVQYKLMNRNAKMSLPVAALLMWFLIITASAIVFILAISVSDIRQQFLDYLAVFLAYLNSIADLVIGVAALLIIRAFQGGALGKPWWGFLILGASDFFYAWLIQTDAYAYETLSGDLLRFASDLAYMLAYLLIGYGFLQHYLLLHFGPPQIESRFKR
jgi:hypothetical protein